MSLREDKVRSFLIYLEEKEGKSKKEIADLLEYDRSYISKIVNKGLKASEDFLNKVERLMQEVGYEQEEKEHILEKPIHKSQLILEIGREDKECIGGYFRWTRDAKNVVGFCKATKDKAKMSAILGKAGSGKSKTLKEFASMHDDVIYIRCMKIWKKKHIIKKIATQLGIVLTGTDEDDNFVQVAEALIEEPRMIIFDEFDHLITQKSTAKIEVIRDLYDEIKHGGSSIIIAGSPILKTILTKRTSTDNYGQIDSRIYLTYMMQDLKEDEILGFLEGYDMTQEAKELLLEKALEAENGRGRYLEFSLNKCLDLSGNQMITKKHVIGATKLAMLDMD